MKKGIGAYDKARTASTTGLSRHALTMKIYKEIHKQLELCNFVFERKKQIGLTQFLEKKGVTLAKVHKYVRYMIDTANRNADPEYLAVFDQMYYYILNNAIKANQDMDHEALIEALNMSKELIIIWDSIPESERY